jgi:glutamate dehydrogenase
VEAKNLKLVAENAGRRLGEAVADLSPWFASAMPDYYFETHSEEEQVRHISALAAARTAGDEGPIILHMSGEEKVTFISQNAGTAGLLEHIEKLEEKGISAARMYESSDGTLRLDSFVLGQGSCAHMQGAVADLVQGIADNTIPEEDQEAFAAFLHSSTPDCLEHFEPVRAARHFRLYLEMGKRDCVYVEKEDEAYPGLTRITAAMLLPDDKATKESPPRSNHVLSEIVKVLQRRKLDVKRAYADVYVPEGKRLFIVSAYVGSSAEALAGPHWDELRSELLGSKWFARHDLERFADEHGWGLRQVTFLQAACEFAHQFLLYVDAYAYTAHNVVHAALSHKDASEAMLRLFTAKFGPGVANREQEVAKLRNEAQAMIADIDEEIARHVFQAMTVFIDNILRSNAFLDECFGLAFRMDPAFLEQLPKGKRELPIGPEKPYAIYFFNGPYYLGFHVRYRDTARGGVRIVPTRRQEIFELESGRLFDEVTALARSQQYKNKDIPEGGAKAVLLLGPEADIDLTVKSMINSLLDIIPRPPAGADYLNKDEMIYLGPDENVSPEHIEWLVRRAGERSYPYPSSIMSSKPGTGINHKEYGVTSLGVVVFVEKALALIGIDPHTDPFRVKITGGPRGDVAGNAMKILFREYGDKAKIVSVTDGHGAAYDPDGLAHEELLRLVDKQLGIAAFDKTKLTGDGAFALSSDEPGGAKKRNELHNTAEAELFLPGGGRPDTINLKNWREFYTDAGKPSAPIIVEGANLFISEPAREKLENEGVMVFYGAGANKAGVICSSYEILAGFILSDEEFLEHKERYVAEVLEILKKRCADEADLLVREFRAAGGRKTLTELSKAIAGEINGMADRIRDAVCSKVERITDDALLYSLVLAYVPPLLVEKFESRLAERLPLDYVPAMTAHFAAARIVYAEGLGTLSRWADMADVEQAVRIYLEQEHRVDAMAEAVSACAGDDMKEAAAVLRAAGRAYYTDTILKQGGKK